MDDKERAALADPPDLVRGVAGHNVPAVHRRNILGD
jgi:hypothetical protein